jgi:uncharacterized protein (DUF1697 family)
MRFVAFLRAINVGGRNVKMEQLRRIFESVGLTNVETVIASGNVLFDSRSKNARAIEEKLQAKLEKALGYAVATFVRSMDELSAIAAHKPFRKVPDSAPLYIAFAAEAPSSETQEKLLSQQGKTDKLSFRTREIYWLCLTTYKDSKFSGPALERMLGMPVTVRNARTIEKIAQGCCVASKRRD